MSRKLVVSDGTRERELQLVGRIVVGRDPGCDITHDHSLLSRRHAEFVSAGDLVVVRDLGSRNGVFVNGAKTAEHSLHPGDIVQIGPLRAQYVVDQSPLSIAPEDHDVDRTAVVRGPAAKASAQAAPAPARPPAALEPPPPAERPDDDDEATRLITARPQAKREPPRRAPDSDDDDETRFIPRKPVSLDDESTDDARAAGAVELASMAADAVIAPTAVYDGGAQAADLETVAAMPSLRGFVFAQLLVFAALVIVVFVIALLGAGVSTPFPALLVSAVVSAAAAFVIAGLIDRRIMRAATAQDTP